MLLEDAGPFLPGASHRSSGGVSDLGSGGLELDQLDTTAVGELLLHHPHTPAVVLELGDLLDGVEIFGLDAVVEIAGQEPLNAP